MLSFLTDLLNLDWCIKGHVGYILDGSCSIDFNGEIVRFTEGDGLFIPEGNENKHKAILGLDERILLVLFETL